MSDLTTYVPQADKPRAEQPHAWALALLHCEDDPSRVGEVAILTADAVLGRHGTLPWARHDPAEVMLTGPLSDRQLSRVHLHFDLARTPTVRNAGRLPLRLNRRPIDDAQLADGDVLDIGGRVVLLVHQRSALPAFEDTHAFGQPDAHGIVGESPAAWRLRQDLHFTAQRSVHTMILGPSGTGKELVARAIHTRSTRRDGPWIARSAATIPESLADAELFGNCANYPNSGAPERPGLIGAAHGGTLFLDEIGKLPPEVQVRLLRVLDEGEYTRLGEAHARKADIRVIAATNRDPSVLEADVAARFRLRLQVPGLDERRQDIPLIARELVHRITQEDHGLRQRFAPNGVARLSSELVVHLVSRPWSTHVRELDSLLWQAISDATGDVLHAPDGVHAPVAPVAVGELTAERIQACLDKHEGRQEPVWRELGLSSRHVLTRLVKKFDLQVRGRS